MPVSINSLWMSLSRQGVLLMKYCPSPERNTLRVTVTSSYSVFRTPSHPPRVMLTSPMPSGLRVSVPLKMQSSILPPRRALALCSPSTQRTASEILLFPHPFGPTMQVRPRSISIFVLSAKLLKPTISRDLRCIRLFPSLKLFQSS